MLKIVTLAAALLTATAVSAATLVSAPASTGPLASPGSVVVGFGASGGPGAANFIVQGFISLDGVNCCTDTFTLNLNGTDIFSGSFDLGGGGADVIYIAGGATLSKVSTYGLGGELTVGIPLALVSGTNTLTFSYAGAAQGLGDEAWGVRELTVMGSNAVPEPASWALMVAGFGLVGVGARRRRMVVAA